MPGVVKQACNSSTREGQAEDCWIQKDNPTGCLGNKPWLLHAIHVSILITSKHQLGRDLCSPLLALKNILSFSPKRAAKGKGDTIGRAMKNTNKPLKLFSLGLWQEFVHPKNQCTG